MSLSPRDMRGAPIALATVEIDDSPESLQNLESRVPLGLGLRNADSSPPGFRWFELVASAGAGTRIAVDTIRPALERLAAERDAFAMFRIVYGSDWIEPLPPKPAP